MKILCCGDRNWNNFQLVYNTLITFPCDTTVIHGAARGADTIAGKVANLLGMKVEIYSADWTKQGKSAGPIRNRQMLDQKPDLVLAFHNDIEASKGTKDCVTEAKRRGIPVRLLKE